MIITTTIVPRLYPFKELLMNNLMENPDNLSAFRPMYVKLEKLIINTSKNHTQYLDR